MTSSVVVVVEEAVVLDDVVDVVVVVVDVVISQTVVSPRATHVPCRVQQARYCGSTSSGVGVSGSHAQRALMARQTLLRQTPWQIGSARSLPSQAPRQRR